MTLGPHGPLDALVVSSWYPSLADPVSGQFVADQVAALAALESVRPAVVSMDPAELLGSAVSGPPRG
jgi:hypothetical protein